jgi:hypothetical protein
VIDSVNGFLSLNTFSVCCLLQFEVCSIANFVRRDWERKNGYSSSASSAAGVDSMNSMRREAEREVLSEQKTGRKLVPVISC